jgi:hypothetical protein
MMNQTEVSNRTHRRAVRFFWGFLIGATTISLASNITHAVLSYIPRIVVQIGAATVPPIALLAAVHGIALAVRAGASGRIYCWAVTATAAIGVGAFTVSFLALRDLMRAIGYSTATAWVFPAIIDTAVAVSTMMLVALGDKPARRVRTANLHPTAMVSPSRRTADRLVQGARSQVSPVVPQRRPMETVHPPAQTETPGADTDLAAELIESRVTTQPIETVVAVLATRRDGASINSAARQLGINYRTAQRIVEGAERRQRELAAAS